MERQNLIKKKADKREWRVWGLKESEECRAHKEGSNQIPQEPSKNKNPIGYVRETKAVLRLKPPPSPHPPVAQLLDGWVAQAGSKPCSKYKRLEGLKSIYYNSITFFLTFRGPCIISTEWQKKTGTFEKPNKNWRNPRKKIYWQKLNHYNLPFKRQ